MYCKALTGSDVAVHSAETLVGKGIGWVDTEVPSTEGTAIYLPAWVEDFREKEENFRVYKVYSTHQAAHLEFGTFDFQFEREGQVFPNRRRRLEKRRAKARGKAKDGEAAPREPLTDIERFFDLFPDRRLASDLFVVLEDARIDMLVGREYAGIRRPHAERQSWELKKRPAVDKLPLRQAFVENLVRASLGGLDRIVWPDSLRPLMQRAISLTKGLRRPAATVEDTAEATIRVYQLAERIPNLLPESMDDWEEMEEEAEQAKPTTSDSMGKAGDVQLPQDEEATYQSPDSVDFRGELKPEMVQLLMRMREEREGEEAGPLSPLTPEQLKAMLEKSVEVTISDMAEADLSQLSDLLLTNLVKDMDAQEQERQQMKRAPLKDGQPVSGLSSGDDGQSLPVEPKYFYYDEWDFRAGDYRPNWCRIVETPVTEGAVHFFDQTLTKYASLVHQTRRQFELMRPDAFRKIKRLLDGEEFDLDAVTDYVVERKAGQTPSEKVYWRRNKVERDVSVAFLLDMSASTDEEITKHERRQSQEDYDDDPRRYFSWWMSRRAQELLTPPKRIIDLEKESIVLLIRALETIGDTYGIYGFSGYGRDNVEFYVVKDMEETFSERVKKRIDKVAPVRSTRMGPSIRHATAKLEAQNTKVRILFLLSDGRPQDHGYGRDRTEKEYAIHDTHMALVEAKRKGIVPFCLTVDRYGHDYLKQMCDDVGYAVVPDIESLPSRITSLYRRLTA
jgi:nitric oxide reductase activation protein